MDEILQFKYFWEDVFCKDLILIAELRFFLRGAINVFVDSSSFYIYLN